MATAKKKSADKKSAGKAKKVAKPAKAAKPAKKAAKPAKKAAKPAKKSGLVKGGTVTVMVNAPGKKPHKRVLKPAKKVKADFKRVPLRIVHKSPTATKRPEGPVPEVDTAKAVAFAMSIAQEMKRSAAKDDKARSEREIRLTRRPTTRSQGKSTVSFPKKDLQEFRKRLIDARAKALSGVNAMRATGFNEADDHEADGGDGTNQTLRLQALGQMGTINRMIQQIDEALHRIDDGTYGVCTVCGQLIRKPRLLNQPFVLTCMECQSEMEKGHR